MNYQTPRGTYDILPEEMNAWHDVENVIRDVTKLYRYQEIRTPYFESTNVFNLFQSAGFSRKFLEEINELRPAKNTVSRGPFEILCDLFITDVKDVANNSTKNIETGEGSGDVHTELCGALEFKADGARVQGHAPEGITIINKTFDKYTSKLFPGVEFNMLNKGYFSSVGAITSITEQLLNAGCDFDTYIEILVECMTAQFPVDKKDKDSLRQFLNKTNGVFFPRDLKLKFEIKKSSRKKDAPIISTGKIDTKDFNFTTLWGIIDMYFYHKREKWPYMIVFDSIKNNYGEYYVLNGKNCDDFEDIYNEVRSGNIYFEGLPTGNGFDAAVKIHKGSK